MKRALLLLLAVLVLAAGVAQAKLLASGQSLPEMTLTAPLSAEDAGYLGVELAEFGVPDVEAEYVLIEVFNAYCPHCQAEAKELNRLHGLMADAGLGDRLKMIGIGANNTEFEVKLFRDKYAVPFPLVVDESMAAAKAMGVTATPTFLLVRVDSGKGEVLHVHEGRIPGSAEEFLALIREKSGL